MTHVFDAALKVPLPGSVELQFGGTNEFVTWAKQEIGAWGLISDPRNIRGTLEQGAAAQQIRALGVLNSAIGRVEGAASSSEAQIVILESLSPFRLREALCTSQLQSPEFSPVAIAIKSGQPREVLHSLVTALSVRPMPSIESLNAQIHLDVATVKAELGALKLSNAEAAQVAGDLEISMRQKVEALQKATDEFFEQANTRFGSLTNQLGELIKQSRLDVSTEQSLFDADREQRAKEWGEIKAAYLTDMKLRGPIAYWRDMRSFHDKRANNRLHHFLWEGIIGALAFAVVAFLILKFLDGAADWPNARWALMFGLPLIIFLARVRNLAREQANHRTLANDAAERVAMVQTFKAMEATGKADVNERKYVMEGLFRPAAIRPADSDSITIVDQVVDAVGRRK